MYIPNKEIMSIRNATRKGTFLGRKRVIKDASNYIEQELAKIGAVPTQFHAPEPDQLNQPPMSEQSLQRKNLLG